MIKQLDEMLATKPEQSPFVAPMERDTDPQFHAAYQAVVRDEIDPAMRRTANSSARRTFPPHGKHWACLPTRMGVPVMTP